MNHQNNLSLTRTSLSLIDTKKRNAAIEKRKLEREINQLKLQLAESQSLNMEFCLVENILSSIVILEDELCRLE